MPRKYSKAVVTLVLELPETGEFADFQPSNNDWDRFIQGFGSSTSE